MTEVSILVIDDEPEMVDMMAFCLEQRGYRVSTTTSGSAAVELARKHRFHLAICDLKMPGWDGIRTAAALKEILPDLKVVIATGYATEETMSSCLARGASDYIRKPFTMDELDGLIGRLLPS